MAPFKRFLSSSEWLLLAILTIRCCFSIKKRTPWIQSDVFLKKYTQKNDVLGNLGLQISRTSKQQTPSMLVSTGTQYSHFHQVLLSVPTIHTICGPSIKKILSYFIYSVHVTKNHQKIWSRCLVHKFSLTYIFNDINHGYRAAILKKNSLWLLPFYMAVATYFYYKKVCIHCSCIIPP